MSSIPFCKFHGFGNDYIVIESRHVEGRDLSALAIAICDRHRGAGADGIAVIDPAADTADFDCEIVNPDGSIAGFSGNGTRCAVAYIYFKNLWSERRLRLRVPSGVKNFQLLEDRGQGNYLFEAEIGTPKFRPDEVPFSDAAGDDVIDRPVDISGRTLLVSGVNTGNPVACVFVDEFPENWRETGRMLESHPLFPAKANIVFVRVVDRQNLELRIWERAVGETSSSGTCVSGAAALAAYKGLTDRKTSVHTEGGITEFMWKETGEIVITGTAELAYCGDWTQ